MRTDTGKITLSQYKLTDAECKLVYYLLKQAQTDGGDLAKYRYAVEKLMEVTGITEQNKYAVYQMMTNLFQKVVCMNGHAGWIKYHWFDSLEWDSAGDVLTVGFNAELKPRLLALRKQHTLSDFKDMNAHGIFPWSFAQASSANAA